MIIISCMFSDPTSEVKESMTELLVAEGLVELRKMGLGAPNE